MDILENLRKTIFNMFNYCSSLVSILYKYILLNQTISHKRKKLLLLLYAIQAQYPNKLTLS